MQSFFDKMATCLNESARWRGRDLFPLAFWAAFAFATWPIGIVHLINRSLNNG